jgi:type IV pilus assembly protein PilC
MSIFPRTFPKYITSMIQVGEATGLLEESLDSVISLMEERIHISRRVITSLIYPTIVLLAVPAAAVFLIWYVFPRMMPFITSMGGKLSWNVELMIALAEGFPIYAPKILLGIGIAAGIIVICYLLPTTRYYIDLFKLHLPLFGTVFQYALVYHFTRVLSVLLESGVPILDALRIIDESTGNHAAKRVIQEMAERVLRGDDLSAPLLKATNVFPPVVGTSVRVGEETGSIDSSLSMIADMFRDLLETQLNRLVAFVEPALILFLGALVGFVASTMVSAIISSYGRLAA